MRDQSAAVRVAAARAWAGLRGVQAVPAIVRMLLRGALYATAIGWSPPQDVDQFPLAPGTTQPIL